MEQNEIKCVVIGDGAVGKTCMLQTFLDKEFPTHHVPTIFENSNINLLKDGKIISLKLFDTAGQEEFDHLRLLAYPGANIFLVCFSVMSISSLNNVESKWIPELKEKAFNVPFILIGLKKDLRNDKEQLSKLKESNKQPIRFEQGAEVAQRIGARGYMECSAKNNDGLTEVFDKVVEIGIMPKRGNKDSSQKDCLTCSVL